MIRLSGPTVNKANVELVTAAQVKSFLRQDGQTVDDVRLGLVVDMVNRWAYNRLRQRIVKSTGTAYDLILDGTYDGLNLFLPFKPIVSVTSIESGYYQAGSGWSPTYTYATTDYARDDETGVLYAGSGVSWPIVKNSIRIVYQAGYVAPLPEDLVGALLQVASIEYNRASAERLDQTSQATDVGATSYTFGTIPGTADTVFRSYTRKWGMF